MGHRAVADPRVRAAGNPQLVAVTASPMTYTNSGPNAEALYFTVPTGVTATIARGGVTLLSLLTPAATTVAVLVLVPAGGAVVFTFNAGAPTITRDVL